MSDQVNPALNDIEEIATVRPELSQEQWEVVNRDDVIAWIKSMLKPEVRKDLEVAYAKSQVEFEAAMRAEMQKAIKERMDEWQKEQAPLSQDELQKLLNQ